MNYFSVQLCVCVMFHDINHEVVLNGNHVDRCCQILAVADFGGSFFDNNHGVFWQT